METRIKLNIDNSDPVIGLTINDVSARLGDQFLYDIKEISPGIYLPTFKYDIIRAIEKNANDIANSIMK